MTTQYIRYPGAAIASTSFPLLAPDGSAAAPSYSFTNDPDCGMYRVGANSIGFSTGGLVALTLTSAQNATFAGTLTGTSFISSTANPASAGVIRLAYLDTFKFRNSNNNGDLSLVQSSTDGVLTYNGDDIVLRTLAQTLTTKTLTTPIISGVSDGSSASAGKRRRIYSRYSCESIRLELNREHSAHHYYSIVDGR
jgi:hypothetical protein